MEFFLANGQRPPIRLWKCHPVVCPWSSSSPSIDDGLTLTNSTSLYRWFIKVLQRQLRHMVKPSGTVDSVPNCLS